MKTTKPNKRKVNILDVVLLVVLIVAVVVAAATFTGVLDKKQITTGENITVKFEVRGEEPEILNYLSEGETIIDGVSKEVIGTVVSIYESPAKAIVENHLKNTVESVEIPNKIDVVLEIEGIAKVSPSDISVGSLSLKVGKSLDCIVGGAAASGTIIGIEYDEVLTDKEVPAK